MDHSEFNRIAWDNIATSKQQWFAPVDRETIDAARRGDWSIRLTGTRPIPSSWIDDVAGQNVLCLAGGGGHQGPLLAAAGANVTVFDISEQQLEIDARVAKQNGLEVSVIAGDMRNLAQIADDAFDLIGAHSTIDKRLLELHFVAMLHDGTNPRNKGVDYEPTKHADDRNDGNCHRAE